MPPPELSSRHDESVWTVDTLRQHLQDLMEANDRRTSERFDSLQTYIDSAQATQKESVQLALAAVDRAMQKADTANEKRFDGVNEFRGTLADQQRMLMPRAEVEVILKSMDERIKTLSDLISTITAKSAGSKEGWGWAAGVIGLVLGVLGVVGFILASIPSTP